MSTSRVDTLARLMATENLSVVHSASAPTASFSMDSRTLTLPVWAGMSDSLYDMLVGHEVAHALWTPFESIKGFEADIARVGDNFGVAKDFVNIVEDARIERAIKAKYPGLKRDFVRGYDEMMQRDLFGIGDGDVNDLPFIDRLNIHFKCGSLAAVQFNADEQVFVDRMERVSTWDEVLDLAHDLYDYCAQNEPQDQQQNANGVESAGGDSDESGVDSESDGGSSSGNDEGDSDEKSDGASSPDGKDGDEDGDSSDSSMTGDTGEGDEGAAAASQGASKGDGPVPTAPTTQRAMEQSLEQMRDESGKNYHYGTIPTCNLEHTVIPMKDVVKQFNSESVHMGTSFAVECSRYDDFRRESGKIVGQMAQWFEMKRRADEDANTMTALTGEIDLERLVDYKFSEDIFLRNEVVPEGKNHGIVVLLDWSGSMSGLMEDTVKQALQLIWFCERVNIPCEVYAFTSQRWDADGQMWGYTSDGEEKAPRFNVTDGTFTPDNWLNLLQFYTSSASARDRRDALHRLWYLGRAFDGHAVYIRSKRLALSGTPLPEAMMAMDTLLADFRARHGVQIMNLCVLSDGCGTPSCMNVKDGTPTKWTDKVILRDPKSRKEVEWHRQCDGTSAIAEMLKIRHGINVIGFYISAARQMPSFSGLDRHDEKNEKQWKSDKFVSVSHGGFDEYFVIQSQKVENDPLDNLGSDATITKVRNAFIKGAKSLKTSRIILGRVIDLVA